MLRLDKSRLVVIVVEEWDSEGQRGTFAAFSRIVYQTLSWTVFLSSLLRERR